MLKKSFLARGTKSEQMALQITSMADIFVIILVFLLKTYSVEGLPYEPSMPLTPPTAKGRFESDSSTLKLEVSKAALSLGGKKVLAMDNFHFGRTDLDTEGTSKGLRAALAAIPAPAAPTDGKAPATRKLMVVADEGSPYETIKAVLSSAASEGFLDIQLAVNHAN